MTKPNPEHKVTICHAVSGKGELKDGYNQITVDVASIFKQGHDHHIHDGRTDIIPPFEYIGIEGDVHQYPGLGDQSFLPDCRPPESTTTTTHKPYPTTTTTQKPYPTTTTTEKPTTTTTQKPTTTTTSTTTTSTTTSTTSTTTSSTTSTTSPSTTSTTVPEVNPLFGFSAVTSICIREVPTIRIVFLNARPDLAGRTGTLTLADLAGNVQSTQPLVYQPGSTVDVLYPGTRVNADGSIADVPGWNLTAEGLWARDSTDAYLRDGIRVTYEVNPTATAVVTYPPESSACFVPTNPTQPGTPISTVPSSPPPSHIAFTGSDTMVMVMAALALILVGLVLYRIRRARA